MHSERRLSRALKIAVSVIAALGMASAGYGQSQGVVENFNSVTGSPGAIILEGGGFNAVTNWDDGLVGEQAFAGTTGYARLHPAQVSGSATGGVGGTGAGVLQVSNVNYNMLDENFAGVTGTGGGVFLAGGSTANTFGYTTSWDNGIYGEGAFAGTSGGAILVGGASAMGVTTGGYGNNGGMGQIHVDNVNLMGSGGWYGGLQFSLSGGFPGAAVLVNAGFESGAKGSKGAPGWNAYGNMYTEGIQPHSGALEAKLFGVFPGNSGIYQIMPAQAGQTWEMDGYGRTGPSDSIFGTGNQLVFRIEFRDAAGAIVGTQQQVIVTGTSPTGTWIHVIPALQATAPAGTVTARPVIEFIQSGTAAGSAFADDISFRVVAGTPPVDLSQFSLTTRIKGAATAPGEVVGSIQFRIEDPSGNRLLLNSTATTSWTQIGGPLSTFTEADPNGVPASNVFNSNADSYTVVLAFRNDGPTPWGTGGTLDIDDLYLTNTNSAGSSWYAGFYWPNVTLTETDLTKLQLQANVKGSKTGGSYELRVEGFKNRQAGLNEDFAKATGTGGGIFLAPANVPPGGSPGVIESGVGNWDDGITGENAFGGLFGYAEFFDPDNGGISAQSVTDPIQGKCGELRVACVTAPPSGGWYAGLTWAGQILPSTDLSTVVLSAKVRGMAETVCGGGLGTYELRIEDAQGDRLYFPMTANGNWQTVGGPLSTAIEGPRLGGGGDGQFNLDSPTYTVVVAFTDPMVAGTWEFGGVLRVDNLFMTPATVSSEIGRVSFPGTIATAGTFQNAGGLLSTGTSNFGGLNENFNNATGTGGGEFYLLHGGGSQGGFQWDDGITGEQCFAGIWGTGTIGGGVWADACTTCGMSNGKAGELRVEGATVGTSGGWWAGLDWPAIRLDLSAGTGNNLPALSGITLSANVKGVAGVSGLLGKYELRIEDADGDCIGFIVTSNGSFQSVGGPLSTATRYNGGAGNNSFNYSQGSYTVTLVMTGGSGTGANTWGSGGKLIVDNLFLTGATFASADFYHVVLSFENGIPSWGTSGTLTMDNLVFGPLALLGDMDCSGAVNLADISPFVQALIDPAGYATAHPGCNPMNGDFTGNGVLDGRDIQGFVQKLIAG